MTTGATHSTILRTATTADAALLARLGATTFSDTFAAHNTPEDMALYLAETFGDARQHAELADGRHTAFILERFGETAGYAMLREGPAPPCISGQHPVEIMRFYVVNHLLRMGLGSVLMHRCLQEAAARGKDSIWLDVWEHNARAIGFYARCGFSDVGEQVFMLGRDPQTDRLMMRHIVAEV